MKGDAKEAAGDIGGAFKDMGKDLGSMLGRRLKDKMPATATKMPATATAHGTASAAVALTREAIAESVDHMCEMAPSAMDMLKTASRKFEEPRMALQHVAPLILRLSPGVQIQKKGARRPWMPPLPDLPGHEHVHEPAAMTRTR